MSHRRLKPLLVWHFRVCPLPQHGPAHPELGRLRNTLETFSELHVKYEGVYLRLVDDFDQAADYVKDLTLALAKQPYEVCIPREQYTRVCSSLPPFAPE